MGKYTRKHLWGYCEFEYKHSCKGKRPGEKCDSYCMALPNGKFFCASHKPKRLQILRELHQVRAIKKVKEQQAKLKIRMERLGLVREVSISVVPSIRLTDV